MYEILNINGERTEAEVLDMLLDNEHGVSLSHVMGELNLYPNQARNCIARLEYIPASNPKQYYVIDKLRKRKGEERLGDDIGYEGFLRVNYSTEIYRLTTKEG